MKAPGKPHNEEKRLAALSLLNILDTPAEERFDRLTRLACKMLNTPAALVSLVADDRQWFKSSAGLEGVEETPRDISFCGHTILQDGVFIVNDTLKDERFVDNPLVVHAPNIRFYAAFPLYAVTGERLGAFCVVDQQPRDLSSDEIETLEDLARIAERELCASYLATTDETTGLCNRSGFELLADKLMHACARSDVPISAVFFRLTAPIDGEDGTLTPDVISLFSQKLAAACREADLVARIDDQHFGCLLNDCPYEQVAHFMRRIEYDVEQLNREQLDKPMAMQSSWLAYNPIAHHSVGTLVQQGTELLDVA